jgi:hypothetical protein
VIFKWFDRDMLKDIMKDIAGQKGHQDKHVKDRTGHIP